MKEGPGFPSSDDMLQVINGYILHLFQIQLWRWKFQEYNENNQLSRPHESQLYPAQHYPRCDIYCQIVLRGRYNSSETFDLFQ